MSRGARGSYQRGVELARRGDWAGAAEALGRAHEATPDDRNVGRELARAWFAMHDLERAETLAARLQTAHPGWSFPPLLQGHAAKAAGDLEAARAHYRRALDCEPTCGEAIYNLVDLEPPACDDPLALETEALAARDDLTPADRINGGFARGRILDRAGRYREAMEWFERANGWALEDLARHGVRYQPAERERRVSELISAYAEPRPGLPPLPVDLGPIFVVGLPRSGTTLIEQILAGHPRVQAGGELTAARRCEQAFRLGRGQGSEPDLLEDARERYLDALFERGLDGPRVVDKMPANFEVAGFLRLMFPDAPIVHVVRDPRATCFSLFTANFAAHEPYYHSLAHLAHYHRQYQRLMAHWRRTVTLAEVRYEDLVREPDREIPALLRAVGLDPHPDCLAFYRNPRPVFTASHRQVRRPIHTGAVDHWRHYEPWLDPVARLG